MRLTTLSDRLSLLVVFALASCLAPPRPQRERLAATPLVVRTPAATATPTNPPAADEATPTATATPEQSPEAEAEEEEVEPPSLLPKITDATRPNVAASLRLIEDGRTLLVQEDYDHALDRLERALAIDPSNAYGYYFLARVHYEKHNYDQTIAFADKAALLSARDDRPWAARAYALQGAAFEAVGRFPDARAAYRKALAMDPHSGAASAGITRLGGNATAP
ncbi:MAG: tetratricopeptide repeat protein [Deltaproteobacteria bacterium]|nr:tetratricopeptide repeat protein [Deltaproteobacteria bacterium]